MAYFFTSESVSEGHPDKIADQISDAVLDAILEQDPKARVACETYVKTGMVMVGGEITTSAWVDIEELTREFIVKDRLRFIERHPVLSEVALRLRRIPLELDHTYIVCIASVMSSRACRVPDGSVTSPKGPMQLRTGWARSIAIAGGTLSMRLTWGLSMRSRNWRA